MYNWNIEKMTTGGVGDIPLVYMDETWERNEQIILTLGNEQNR